MRRRNPSLQVNVVTTNRGFDDDDVRGEGDDSGDGGEEGRLVVVAAVYAGIKRLGVELREGIREGEEEGEWCCSKKVHF
ncbi:hypothetical protein JHK82_054010 [Glycine max]|uniref:Uncharacterized protein n=1 Tax=Glycine max TaxID=3847 RepID=A0A0R0EZP3_SOYBN|nr:hypothetical protein JHK86_053857 [Glycine max]KAG4928325.1 hypothetical protein JHK85_054811 [Glycine max]KAG5083846.1 hypothetical protein JHK84_053884 [Glycine max]KAG5086613.1 hypothetical protein JHK82_054010 [Glycine max]KAH1078489.1 hypothetical protein GYH30_053479 [Glycine max]